MRVRLSRAAAAFVLATLFFSVPRPALAVSIASDYFAQVFVNGQRATGLEWVGVDEAGAFYVEAGVYERLAITQSLRLRELSGLSVVRLDDLPGVALALAEAEDRLSITVPVALLPVRKLDFDRGLYLEDASPVAAETGAKLDYTVTGNWSTGSGSYSLFLEPAVFGPLGYLRSSFRTTAEGSERLATSLTIDSVDRRHSWVIGDNVTRPGRFWGSAEPFTGIALGTDFALDPSFRQVADLSLFHVSELPAVMRVLSEGQELLSRPLPPGQLEINNLPLPDAAGLLDVEIEDLDGNRRTYQLPYLQHQQLLPPGVMDYWAGFGRSRSGADSGGWVSSATLRYGLSERLSGELHGGSTGEESLLGATATRGFASSDLLLSTGAAVRDTSWGTGYRAVIQASNIDRGGFNWGLSASYFSKDHYRPSAEGRASGVFRGNLGLQGFGAVGAGYTTFHDKTPEFSVSYTRQDNLFGLSSNIMVQYSDRANGGWYVGWQLSLPLGERRVLTSQVSQREEQQQASVNFNQLPPFDRGFGYFASASRASTQTSSTLREAAGLSYRSRYGDANLSGSRDEGRSTFRGRWSGSVGYLRRRLFLSQSLSRPFAIVETGDARNIPIYRDSTRVANSNGRGWALVPNLNPYRPNAISIRPDDVGLDISLDGVPQEKLLIPQTRGGIFVDFPLRRQVAAQFRLVRPDGDAVPPGSRVTVRATGEQAFVTRDGLVYLEAARDEMALSVDMGRFGNCAASVALPDDYSGYDIAGSYSCE